MENQVLAQINPSDASLGIAEVDSAAVAQLTAQLGFIASAVFGLAQVTTEFGFKAGRIGLPIKLCHRGCYSCFRTPKAEPIRRKGPDSPSPRFKRSMG